MDEVAETAERIQGQRRQFERSRIEMMRGYAELHDCRREYLLNYFGEEMDDPCSFCDNCEVGPKASEGLNERTDALRARVEDAVIP